MPLSEPELLLPPPPLFLPPPPLLRRPPPRLDEEDEEESRRNRKGIAFKLEEVIKASGPRERRKLRRVLLDLELVLDPLSLFLVLFKLVVP